MAAEAPCGAVRADRHPGESRHARAPGTEQAGSVAVTQCQRRVCRYAAKRWGASNPRVAMAFQASPVNTSGASSRSQSTSSVWPWLSSSTHDRQTRVLSPGCVGITRSATRYKRCRTRAIWPRTRVGTMRTTLSWRIPQQSGHEPTRFRQANSGRSYANSSTSALTSGSIRWRSSGPNLRQPYRR